MIYEILADAGVSGVCDGLVVVFYNETKRLDYMVHFDRQELDPFDGKRFVKVYRPELYRRILFCRQFREIRPDEVVENVAHYLRHDVFGRIYRERVVAERKHEVGENRKILDVVEVRVSDDDVLYPEKLVRVKGRHDRACVNDS